MDSDFDNQDSEQSTSVVDDSPVAGQSRRRFTRSAAVGSAVLLTLGNRAAWGTFNHGGGHNKLCISQRTWDSYTAGTASIAPHAHFEEAREFEAYASYSRQEPKLKHRHDGSKEYCVGKKKKKDKDWDWDWDKDKDKDWWDKGDHYSHKDDHKGWDFGGKHDKDGWPW